MAKRYRFRSGLATLALLGVLCPPAQADMGIPTVALLWPASWLLLVPVVLVEAWVAHHMLALPCRRALRVAWAANLVSTLIGIPAAGLVIGSLQALCLWQMVSDPRTPFERFLFSTAVWSGWSDDWMIPASAVVLCVPFFLVSVYSEQWYVARCVPEEALPRVWRWAWTANSLSYGLIEVWLGALSLLAIRS